MPKTILQGQAAFTTEAKQIGLSYAWRQNLSAHARNARGKGYPYYHLDLNCGSGVNEIAGCAGSPLTFLSSANPHNQR